MILGTGYVATWRKRFKVYWIGNANSHERPTGRTGCNHRYVLAKGQPKNGFASAREAIKWMSKRLTRKTWKVIAKEAAKKPGVFFSLEDKDPFPKRWIQGA
jgi:hypothetical protein